MEKNKRCLFWGKAEIKRQNMLLKASLRQVLSVPSSDKWLCSLTSPWLNLHILNSTGNFKKEKNNAQFLGRQNLISKTKRKAHSILWFLWHSILQNEITKSEGSSTAKWKVVSLQKWTFPCSEVWIHPFCQIFTGNTLYSQKDHPFSLALSIGFNVSHCHLIKILLRDTGVLIVHKRLAEFIYLTILNQKMFSLSLGLQQNRMVPLRESITWVYWWCSKELLCSFPPQILNGV